MSQPSFKDHFSTGAAEYATFRPRYPAALFEFVAGLAPARNTVWDCATGSGQAAVPLAEHFGRVIATDGSSGQIEHATPHPRISYRVALADDSGIDARTIDLVTVAQALHWFPLERFVAEVRRVVVPGGVLAVWCYQTPLLGGAVEEILERYYVAECGPYWPPERALVESGYRTLELPFSDVPVPSLDIELPMTLEGFGGYLRTWSATRRLAAAVGHDPVIGVLERLRPLWGSGERLVRWPVRVRAGRVSRED